MDVLPRAIRSVVQLFEENKETKAFSPDFIAQSMQWVRKWFIEDGDDELVNKLTNSPSDAEAKGGLKYLLKDLLKNGQFKQEMEEWLEKVEKIKPKAESEDALFFENGHALIIGIGGNRFEETAADAQALYDVLTDTQRAGYPPSQVNLLTNEKANREGILQALDQLYESTKDNKDATIFIFYSGHGNIRYENGGETYYIVPNGLDNSRLKETWVTGLEISEKVNRLKSKKLLFLLDCCHAAGIKQKGDEEPSAKELIKTLEGGEGKVFIASCSKEEKSYILPGAKNSLFTACTMEVLNGSNSRFGDKVHVADLIQYLMTVVPFRIDKAGEQQHPVINEVTNLSEFYICRYNKITRSKSKGAGDDVEELALLEKDAQEAVKAIDSNQIIKTIEISNSKNVISGSNISAGGNVTTGDGNTTSIVNNYYGATPPNKGVEQPSPSSSSSNSELPKNIRDLIANNKIKQAINALFDAKDSLDSDINTEVSALSRQFKGLARDQRMGVKSSAEINLETNRITYSLLEIANILSE